MTDLGFHYRMEPGEGSGTMLLLHGTGGDESDLLPLGRSLAPDATLLSVRGRVLEQGMPRFFRRLAPGVFDEEDLHRRTDELAAFVRAAAAEHGLDPAQIDALGYSNGANIAASLLLLHPGLLRRAVLLRAQLPLAPEAPVDLRGARVLIAAGRTDPQIPAAEAQALADALQACGADVELHWADAGHALGMEEIDAAREWLGRTRG